MTRRIMQAGFWLALAVVTAVTLMPSSYEQGMGINIWDKAEHFAAFALLALLGLPAFPRLPGLAIVALVTLHGGLIEIVQGMVGRDRDWHDLLADGLGALAAWGLVMLLRRTGVDLRSVSR